MSKKFTVRQAAQLMSVSERSIYKAIKVRKLRPDLGDKCMTGEMTLDAAYRLATGKPKVSTWDRLARAYLAATDDDRRRLIDLIDQSANLQSDSGVAS